MAAQNEPEAPDFGEDFDDFNPEVTEADADFDAEETNPKETSK